MVKRIQSATKQKHAGRKKRRRRKTRTAMMRKSKAKGKMDANNSLWLSELLDEGFRSRHHSLHGMAKQEVGGHCREGSEAEKIEVEEKKGLKLSITEGGNKGESKLIASCGKSAKEMEWAVQPAWRHCA